jgi:energy-converting hydrogenase Eha subunit B
MATAATLLVQSAVLLAVNAPRGTILVAALIGYAGARLAIDPLRQRPPSIAAGRRMALTVFVTCSVLASAMGWLATTV